MNYSTNNKIKIVLFITGLGLAGGAEAIVQNLALYLNKEKFEPIVVSILPLSPRAKKLKEMGVTVYGLTNTSNKFFSLIFSLIKLTRIIKKEKPDILHTHLFHADIIGRIAGRLAGVPFIVSTIHNTSFKSRQREIILFLTKKFVDGNVAVAKIVYNYVLRIGISSRKKLSVIYNGIDNKYFFTTSLDSKKSLRQKLNIPLSDIVVVSVGRLIEQKGFNFLLDAFNIINDKNIKKIKLYILGEGQDESFLKNKASVLPKDMIIFTGNVNNVEEYLRASDIFVMASLWEGFSLSLIEAAASGLPIIATEVGVAPEFIINGTNGYLVSTRNSQMIVEKIEFILQMSDDKKNDMGASAQQIAKEKFTIDNMVRQYEEYYDKCVNK